MTDRVMIWDLPIRLFHWVLVALLGFSWWSADQHLMEWHRWSGYALATLVLFRLLWGIWGSDTARFTHFLRGPVAVAVYVRSLGKRNSALHVGHNPLGGWVVLSMLGLLLIQVGTGLFAIDLDGLESGPLSFLVSFEQGRAFADLHKLAFATLQAFAAFHVAAIWFYSAYKHHALLRPMITGSSRQSVAEAKSLRFAPLSLAFLLFGVAASAILLLVSPEYWPLLSDDFVSASSGLRH